VHTRKRWAARCIPLIAAGGLLAILGLGSTASLASSPLGKPHRATGKPIVFAMINDNGGALSAPEGYEGAQAAVDYVNAYLNGINGRPIKLDECSNTTNAPTASATCASELINDKPALILGGVDTGAAGAFPVWNRANLAYVGGLPFTPVESNASNAVIFSSINGADNAAPIVYAHNQLHADSLSIIVDDDSTDLATATLVTNVAKRLGMTSSTVPLSTSASASQFAAAAAQAESSSPGYIYILSPAECPQAVLAIRSTGYTGHVGAIDICGSPPSIATMGSAANGLLLASPYVGLVQVDTKKWGAEISTTLAALGKYAPKNIAIDTVSLGDFGSVMNLRTTLDSLKGKLTESKIIGAFEKGSNHPNWLAHPYTCNRKQVATQTAVCNGYEQIFQVTNGKITTADHGQWVDGAKYIQAGD
jgi:branched-chain amino acid transport system substrate-binding protein